ncbi:hypothetical protein BROUX41_005649 [Berkeleyomyces rouxiae]|uniref:uncharacterized protein n=1 Tax=Berkeleyomyces rouxiae TaxID=2035830 RepID=UPI003B7F791E
MHSPSPSKHRHDPASPSPHLDAPSSYYSSSYNSSYSYSYPKSPKLSAHSPSRTPHNRGQDWERDQTLNQRDSTYSYTYAKDHREVIDSRYQARSSSPTPPPPPPRTSQPKTFPVSYNTTRKSAVPPPPPPSCESEAVSLAREHGSKLSEDVDTEIYGVCRGELQQEALMVENEDFVPDVIVPHHESTSLNEGAGHQYNPKLSGSTKAFVLVSVANGTSPPQSEQHEKIKAAHRQNHSKTSNKDQQLPHQLPQEYPVIIEHDDRRGDYNGGTIDNDYEIRNDETERDRRHYSPSSYLNSKHSRLDLRAHVKNSQNETSKGTSSSAATGSNSNSSYTPFVTSNFSGAPTMISPKNTHHTYHKFEEQRLPSISTCRSTRQDNREEYRPSSANPSNEFTTTPTSRLFGPKPEPVKPNERNHETPRNKSDHFSELHPNLASANTNAYRYNHGSSKDSPVRGGYGDSHSEFIPPTIPMSIPARPKSSSDRRRSSVVIHDEMPRVSGPRSNEPHMRGGSRNGPGLASSPMPASFPRENQSPMPPATSFFRNHGSNAPYPEDQELPDVMARVGNMNLTDGAHPQYRTTRTRYSSPNPSLYSASGTTGPAGPRVLRPSPSSNSSLRRADAGTSHDTVSSVRSSHSRMTEAIPLNHSAGSWRRYLEDPTRYGLPPLPVCHYGPGSRDTQSVTFMRLHDLDDFDICLPCYKAVFASGPYRHQFVECVKPVHAGHRVCCDFGAVPWFQLGWIMALKRREPRISDIYSKIVKCRLEEGDIPSCSTRGDLLYMYTLRNQWINETNILPDFAICPSCMECVFALLPSIFQTKLCLQVKPVEGQKCALRHGPDATGPRFTKIFDCLETCSDRGIIYNCAPDGHRLVEELGQLANYTSFAECTSPAMPQYNEYWYALERLDDLIVCAECYHMHIKPFRHSEVGKMLRADKRCRAVASCELYSSQMKSSLITALQTQDLEPLYKEIWAYRHA